MRIKHEIIGRAELVGFPELALKRVPAKVDTGADSSAIWASDIRLDKSGKLSFVLFDKASEFYSGDRVDADEYERVVVASANGQQIRYKVKLLVEVGGRQIRGWFTLADRAQLTYPVLIGRRTLHKKFVVDVSRKPAGVLPTGASNREVLVLGSVMPEHQFFKEVASGAKVRLTPTSLNKLFFSFSGGKVSVIDTASNRDVASFGFVYFKSSRRYFELAASAASYLAASNVKFSDRELASFTSYDKLSEMMELSLAGLPVPTSFCAASETLLSRLDEITAKLGWPLIIKEVHEDRGRQNYLLTGRSEVEAVLTSARPNEYFVVQKYVKNNGYLRCCVFGNKLGLVIKRSPVEHKNPKKAHLNNPPGSANASLVDLNVLKKPVKDLAIRAAMCLNRQVAGVDLIYDLDTKCWLVLEVNSAPQLVSGSFPSEKLTALTEYIGGELE